MSDEKPPENAEIGGWSRVLAATGSPLKLFALIVLVCNTVFGVAAAWTGKLEAFTYSIHMFLAIVASFVLIALWSPRSLYHPKELLELRELEKGCEDDEKLRFFDVSNGIVTKYRPGGRARAAPSCQANKLTGDPVRTTNSM